MTTISPRCWHSNVNPQSDNWDPHRHAVHMAVMSNWTRGNCVHGHGGGTDRCSGCRAAWRYSILKIVDLNFECAEGNCNSFHFHFCCCCHPDHLNCHRPLCVCNLYDCHRVATWWWSMGWCTSDRVRWGRMPAEAPARCGWQCLIHFGVRMMVGVAHRSVFVTLIDWLIDCLLCNSWILIWRPSVRVIKKGWVWLCCAVLVDVGSWYHFDFVRDCEPWLYDVIVCCLYGAAKLCRLRIL